MQLCLDTCQRQNMTSFTYLQEESRVVLRRNESLILRAGCIAVMSGHLRVKDKVYEPIANETLFLNHVYLPSNAPVSMAHVVLSSPAPGTIIRINLREGISWVFREDALIAATGGVKIEHRYNLTGPDREDMIFKDQIVPLTRVSISSSSHNLMNTECVYIYSFGKYRRHVLDNEKDTLVVNGGLFLACPEKHMTCSVEPAGGSIFTAIAGVLPLHMRFKGPSVILTQTHNFEAFASRLCQEEEENERDSYAVEDEECIIDDIGSISDSSSTPCSSSSSTPCSSSSSTSCSSYTPSTEICYTD